MVRPGSLTLTAPSLSLIGWNFELNSYRLSTLEPGSSSTSHSKTISYSSSSRWQPWHPTTDRRVLPRRRAGTVPRSRAPTHQACTAIRRSIERAIACRSKRRACCSYSSSSFSIPAADAGGRTAARIGRSRSSDPPMSSRSRSSSPPCRKQSDTIPTLCCTSDGLFFIH